MQDTKVKNLKIVDETIAYIKELEECLEGLKQRKAVVEAAAVCLPTHRNASSSVDVTVSGKVWFFGVRSKVVRRGLVNDIFTVFNRHGAEVLGASVAVHEQELRLTVTALVDNDTINGAAANFVADTIKTDLILLLLIPPGI
uniref:Uncharacterized protein n=1 Tax=Nelumbo nucifera TaxID=4432 RepID=A0A822Z3A6_NELNU|nr:TPA_asm: hypothetical protein HUJ06_008586 [Nelumbo nucifera]